jgi:hypothetical protein
MRDMDKMTLNEVFGEKSAAFGEGARRLTEDELFQFAEFLLPVGRVKKLKEAGSRGVKVVRDLIDELMGKGKKVSGEVPVAKDPFDLLPKKQDSGLTMKDILQGNQRAMDVPAFEREALGLTKRVRIPGRKQNVETGQQSINEILRLEAPTPSQVRARQFADDLADRVYRGKRTAKQFPKGMTREDMIPDINPNEYGFGTDGLYQAPARRTSERLSAQLERLLRELEM